MFAGAIVAATLIHLSPSSPSAELAEVQRVAPFHVLTLPISVELIHAEIGRDQTGAADVRLEYSSVGTAIVVDEHAAEAADDAGALQGMSETFDLDGYPAIYRDGGPAYHHASSLVWRRDDLTVTLTSADGASAPLLVDIALELR